VEILQRKKDPLIFEHDEFIKADTSLEVLSKLRTAFKKEGGSVTAGNASGLNDGAAAMLLASDKGVQENNLTPIARIVSSAVLGVEPRIMGIGPVKAIPKALNQAGLKQGDLSIIELNEAFASQSLAVIRELDLNPEIINPNGGAISLGHPLGCTGAKLSVQLFDEMRRQEMQGKFGAVTMCVGTGQGACGIFEFLN
jgi:acetyl-CoA acyltransferase